MLDNHDGKEMERRRQEQHQLPRNQQVKQHLDQEKTGKERA